jgi:superfamily II DNA or RNA helicase
MQGVQRLRTSGVEKGSRLAGMYLGAFTKRRQVLAECTAKHARLTELSAAVSAADRTMVFAHSVQAADTAMEMLRASGHHGAVIEAAMDTDERKDAFDAFERGDYRVVAAPRLLDEGVDVPAADLAIVLASSRSRRHMIQRMGRIVRPKDDGRSARLVILYVEGTAEDPVQGAHEDFLDEVLDVAEDCAVFASDSTTAELSRYLAPHGWRRPSADRVCPRSTPRPGPATQRSERRWASDVAVDPDSVTEGCTARHTSYGEGIVVSVSRGGSPMTVRVRFASGDHEIVLGAGHLEFVVE